VSSAPIIIYVASQRVFIVVVVYFVIDSVRKLLDTPSVIIGSEYSYHHLCALIRVIKSGRMIWAGNVARMGEMGNAYKISIGRL
jgi:hypothetical protein